MKFLRAPLGTALGKGKHRISLPLVGGIYHSYPIPTPTLMYTFVKVLSRCSKPLSYLPLPVSPIYFKTRRMFLRSFWSFFWSSPASYTFSLSLSSQVRLWLKPFCCKHSQDWDIPGYPCVGYAGLGVNCADDTLTEGSSWQAGALIRVTGPPSLSQPVTCQYCNRSVHKKLQISINNELAHIAGSIQICWSCRDFGN